MLISKYPLPALQEFIYSTDFMLRGRIQRLRKPSPYPQITHSTMKKNMTNKLLVRLAGSAINIYKGKAMVKCLTLCNQSPEFNPQYHTEREKSLTYAKSMEGIRYREQCLNYSRLTKVRYF